MVSIEFPSRKWLVLIVFLSLINPLHYTIFVLSAPVNSEFIGFVDDGLMLSLMQSSSRNFEDPWSAGGSVFNNPLVGSVYLFILLGVPLLFLKVNPYVLFILYKFIFAFVYYIVAYNFMKFFIKDKKILSTAFILFMLAAGIGGIIYSLAYVSGNTEFLPAIGYGMTAEFEELGGLAHSLTHLPRLYYLIPEILTYVTLLAFATRRKVLTGILLGITGMFYPVAAIMSFIILTFYFLAFNYKKNNFVLMKGLIREFYLIIIISSMFAVPWIVSYLQNPYFFNVVSAESFENFTLLKIIVSYALTLPFVLYFLRKRISLFRRKEFIITSFIILGLFFLEQLYPVSQRSVLFSELMANIGLLNVSAFLFIYSKIIELIAALYAISVVIVIMKSDISKTEKSLFVWIFSFTILAGLYPSYVGFFTGRFGSLLLMSMSILSAYGIAEFCRNKKINLKHVIILILLLSLPSLIAFNARIQKQGREESLSNVYISENDYNALLFLKDLPQGRIIAFQKISIFAPVYSDQKAFFFSGRINENVKDYEDFYTKPDKQQEIIEKYNLTYIFYGDDEKKLNPAFSIDAELIYDDETKVYIIR